MYDVQKQKVELYTLDVFRNVITCFSIANLRL